jgi:hypothetical protein
MLKFEVNTVKPGNFSITYRKDQTDESQLLEFSLKVNKVKKLTDKEAKGKIWNTFSFPLNPGLHQVEIDLMKDPGNLPESRVFIHSIIIEGVHFADTECVECHSFMSSTQGNTCKVCDFNEYFDGEVCEKCPEERYSHRGSVGIDSCILRYPCTMKDFVQLYSPCTVEGRSMYFEWKIPKFCNYLKYPVPPSMPNQPCESCPAGYKTVSQNSVIYCEPCPDGEFSSTVGDSFCVKCPAGWIALKTLTFSKWVSIPEPLVTYCKEATGKYCTLSDGWLAENIALSSGQRLSKGLHLYLDLDVEVLASQGFFKFSYQFLNKTSGSFEVYINGKLIKTLNEKNPTEETISLPQGHQLIQLIYISSEGPEEVRISYIKIQGSHLGGASECVQCPKSFTSAEGSAKCTPCPAGFTSNGQGDLCISCGAGFYTSGIGKDCIKCPEGSISNENFTACIADTLLSLGGSNYFISGLANMNSSSEIENVCSSLSSKLYCYSTFYGPVTSKLGDFYLSVLNPSVLTLPSVIRSSSESPGYCFEYLTEKAGVSPDERETCSQETKIVNYGKELRNIRESNEGFIVEYHNGDFCPAGGRYSSKIHIICDKSEEVGWPSIENRENCSVTFNWKTKFGCKICSDKDLKNVTGTCKEGLREITQIEGDHCILITKKEKISEKCQSGAFKTEVFVVLAVLGSCGIFVVLFGILTWKVKKTQVPLVNIEKPAK